LAAHKNEQQQKGRIVVGNKEDNVHMLHIGYLLSILVHVDNHVNARDHGHVYFIFDIHFLVHVHNTCSHNILKVPKHEIFDGGFFA
jgi:hypothetical protein